MTIQTTMDETTIDDAKMDKREILSAYAHQVWSAWMKYMFDKGTFNEDGSWTMPEWAVKRWQRQAATLYADLPELEKTSDRLEADHILAIIGE